MAATALNDVTVSLDGTTHHGTYYVQRGILYVQCHGGEKKTQVGSTGPMPMAKLLLSQMMRGV
jgi:hypothetical protein